MSRCMPHFLSRDERHVDVSFWNLDDEVRERGTHTHRGVTFGYALAGIRNLACICAEIYLLAIVPLSGCSADAPAPPDMPRAVTSLAAHYDELTATLDADTARTVLEQTIPIQNALSAFWGLKLLRVVVEHATSLTFENDLTDDVQGSIVARASCPGWEPNNPTNEGVRGYVELTLGIDDSRLQRAFAGRIANCRFLTVQAGAQARFVGSMDLEVDLGTELEIGSATSSVLVRATNVSGALNGVELDLHERILSFRMTPDDSIDTRIDLATLHRGLEGTLQLALYGDGTWVLRVREGSWVCDGEGSFSCVFVARA
jgi:hypothetical protein